MSILDWLDVYRSYLEANEPFVSVLLECGDTENEIVRTFNDYKRGYDLLLIEYQSMPSAVNQSRATSARAGDTATTAAQVRT